MFDSRFPNLERFRLYVRATPHARDCVRQIEERTGVNAIINMDSQRVIFRFGDNMGGPHGESLERIERWTGGDVDRACLAINYAKNMHRDVKDHEMAKAEKQDKDAKQAGMEKFCEDVRPNAQDKAGHLDRKRRGVAKVISAPATTGV